MQLNQVIASDEIIFNSEVWLYGDWTNKQVKQSDSMVVRNLNHILSADQLKLSQY